MFFTYYLYKVYQLTKLKFYATYGPILFIFLPFVLFFLLPYLTTGDVELARKLLVAVPSVYILVFIFMLSIAFKYKYRETEDSEKFRMRRTIVVTYLAILFWISLPLWTVLGPAYQDIELLMTNIGFIIFTFLYIFNKICSAKHEYTRLIESEAKLKDLNAGLSHKVREKTKHLVELNEVITSLTFLMR